jgi:Ankyrin repeats (3 copies)
VDVIEILLNEGADCEAENYFGERPMSYAIYRRKADAVRILLDRGATLEHADKWGYISILDAAIVDSHEVLDLLLQRGARTSAKLPGEKTLLHVAALNSDLRTIEILQNAHLHGLDTAALDAAGNTAMDYLRLRNDAADLIEPFGALLLSIEADSTELDEVSPLIYSMLRNHNNS